MRPRPRAGGREPPVRAHLCYLHTHGPRLTSRPRPPRPSPGSQLRVSPGPCQGLHLPHCIIGHGLSTWQPEGPSEPTNQAVTLLLKPLVTS